MKIIDKAQAKKAKAHENSSIPKNSFSDLDKFPASHFVSVAQTCGIKVGGGLINLKLSLLTQ
jgi:hypothetical protein